MTRTKEERDRLIADWKASGLNARQWCLLHKIPTTTFYGWKKISEPNTSAKKKPFIELKDAKTEGITLEYKNIKLHVPKNFDEQTLNSCLQAIRRVSC